MRNGGLGYPEGGIERFLRLAEATGLSRERVISCKEVLPRCSLRGGWLYQSREKSGYHRRRDRVRVCAMLGENWNLRFWKGVIAALREKCEILWAQLDAIYYAYVQPGWAPPGAFHPEQ